MPATPPAAVPVSPAAAPVGPGSTLAPLLNQLGFPASLAGLTPADAPSPIQIGDKAGVTPALGTVPAAVPASAPVPPAGSAPAAQIMPLSALSALP